jgi:flavorubredoxin
MAFIIKRVINVQERGYIVLLYIFKYWLAQKVANIISKQIEKRGLANEKHQIYDYNFILFSLAWVWCED